MRAVEVVPNSYREEDSSFEAIIATENPIPRYDEERGIVVRECLDMDGLQYRGGKNQLPIVDSHNRSSVANVLGSVREIKKDGDTLRGRVYFASDQASQDAAQKVRDGHLTDFSITATLNDVAFLERGKTYRTRVGTEVEGPADIVRSWTPTDASLVATGADERSVVLRSYEDLPTEADMATTQKTKTAERMALEESLLAPLQAKGLPKEITDVNAILAWVAGNMAATDGPPSISEASADSEDALATAAAEMGDELENEDMPEDEEESLELAEESDDMAKSNERAESPSANKTTSREAIVAAERKRASEIRALCTRMKVSDSTRDSLIDEGASLDIARAKILEEVAERSQQVGSSVRVTESSEDKFRGAVGSALVQRCYQNAGVQRPVELAHGAEDFKYMSLRRMAEKFTQRMGVATDRLTDRDIVLIAMGHPKVCARHQVQREAYHTTGSFANLLLDASNKTLLAAYEEEPTTWQLWARTAAPVADFKDINRIRFSEAEEPEHVPENANYPEGVMSDKREKYKVEKYGKIFSVSWETIVNDDLDALSRIPAMHGAACRRKQNSLIYSILTANAAMADGGLLFNTTAQTTVGGHANLASSAAAPSTTSFNAAFTSMATKKGINTSVNLNIRPAFVIAPFALSSTIDQLLGSSSDPSVGGDTTGNSGVLNIWGPGGRRPLVAVYDSTLDSNSTTAWYMAARPNQIDTIEMTFLQGEESPQLDTEWEFDNDTYKHKVRQTFGAAAIDFRGLYKNAGS